MAMDGWSRKSTRRWGGGVGLLRGMDLGIPLSESESFIAVGFAALLSLKSSATLTSTVPCRLRSGEFGEQGRAVVRIGMERKQLFGNRCRVFLNDRLYKY